MENAIEYAVAGIKGKEEKRLQKLMKKEKSAKQLCKDYCKELDTELEEGRKSPMLLSPVINRKDNRREAISEKNTTERCLVKEAVKRLAQEEHIAKYKII